MLRQRPWLLLPLAGCLVSCSGAGMSGTGSPSASGPASYPMARSEFLERMDAGLLASCDAAREEYNLDKDRCLEVIAARTTACAASVSIADPIRDSAQFKSSGRAYLGCAKPFFFCNGVEVKTTDEAVGRCG